MNKIYLRRGDAIDELLKLAPESIDCIVTSPHYNIGTDYGDFKDDQPREEYLLQMATLAVAIRRCLKPNGSLFLNVSGKPTDPWIPHDVANAFRHELVLQNEIHWIKSVTVGEETVGQFKPLNSPRFLNDTHEFIFHFTRTGQVPLDRMAIGVPHTDPSNRKRWASAKEHGLHCRGNCWLIPYKTRQAKGLHPCAFPETLPSWCLHLHGLPPREFRDGFNLCDPFSGLGATAVVAAYYGLNFCGFDLNADYLWQSALRVRRMTQVEPVLENMPLGYEHSDPQGTAGE
jgi:site-specific DNA-methyltransferase (adenine-specific)